MGYYTREEKIPVAKEVDVIVAGGGPAGLAAGLASARNGAQALIVERFNCLGGMGTNGLVTEFSKTASANGGIFKELCNNMKKLGGLRWGDAGFESVLAIFDPEAYKYAAQLMCESSGVNLIFHTFIESAYCEDNVVKGIIISGKSGRQLLRAKIVIDATGDGDVAASAGAHYEKGRDKDGRMQGLTLRPRIGGVVINKDINWKKINEIFERERLNGTINFPWYVTKWLDQGAEGVHGERTVNLDMVTEVDATDSLQLTRAEIEARKRVWEFVFFARKHIPGWEKCYLIDTAMHIGVRETRRIMGEYILTKKDVLSGCKFEDGISKGSFPADLHDPEVAEHAAINLAEHVKANSCPEGDWYEIPYRCLVPKGMDGLLVAGRCISSDREANGSMRIMSICMNTGQAAGTAAAMAIKENLNPSKLNGVKLKETLIKSGTDL